jgi:site-specific recombinase XerD
MASIRREAGVGTSDNPRAGLWEDVVIKFSEEYLDCNLKPGSAKACRSHLRKFEEYFSGCHVAEIDRNAINQFVTDRKSEHVTNATINRYLSTLSRLMRCAVTWEYVEINPVQSYDRQMLLRESRNPIRRPREHELDAVIEEAPSSFGQCLRFLRLTGARMTEGFGVEDNQIEWRNGRPVALTFPITKTNRPRTLDLTDPLLRPAADFIEKHKMQPGSSYLFPTSNGTPYVSPSTIMGGLKKRLAKCGNKIPWSIHDLRHEFAITYLRAGGDIYALKEILGHSSVKVTEIYLGWVPGGRPSSHRQAGNDSKALTDVQDEGLEKKPTVFCAQKERKFHIHYAVKQKDAAKQKERDRLRKWRDLSRSELEILVWQMPTEQVASLYGVSGVAVGKKCQSLKIGKPQRGYWNKVGAGKLPHPNGKPDPARQPEH